MGADRGRWLVPIRDTTGGKPRPIHLHSLRRRRLRVRDNGGRPRRQRAVRTVREQYVDDGRHGPAGVPRERAQRISEFGFVPRLVGSGRGRDGHRHIYDSIQLGHGVDELARRDDRHLGDVQQRQPGPHRVPVDRDGPRGQRRGRTGWKRHLDDRRHDRPVLPHAPAADVRDVPRIHGIVGTPVRHPGHRELPGCGARQWRKLVGLACVDGDIRHVHGTGRPHL